MVCTFSFQLIKNIIRFSSFFFVSFIFSTFLFSNNERPRERMHITPSGIEDFASSRRRIDNLSVWTMFQLFHSTLLESDRAARGRSFFLYTFSTRPREKKRTIVWTLMRVADLESTMVKFLRRLRGVTSTFPMVTFMGLRMTICLSIP